jgi:hypothetical protein
MLHGRVRRCPGLSRRRGLSQADRSRLAVVLIVALLGAWPASAQIAMPKASEMSGIPRPDGALPPGTLTVRLVRDSLANNIAKHKVEIQVGGATRSAETDENGRATFSSLAPGSRVQASATVDGEALRSREFDMPSTGGIRLMLVAAARPDAGGSATAAPTGPAPADPGATATAAKGSVSLSSQSRIVVEHGEDGPRFFYLFDIMNSTGAPVDIGGPVTFELPDGATGATVLEGSTPQATANGPRVIVTGPFQPGPTVVQIGFVLPSGGPTLEVAQAMPIALPQLTVIAEKVGGLHLTSRQFTNHVDREMDGRSYVLANGPGLAPGAVLTLTFENLPHHSRWPRWLALGLALGILAIGAVAAAGSRRQDTSRVDRMVARRDRLLDHLVRVEEDIRTKGADAQRAARREDLVSQLEVVYHDLDEADVSPTIRPVGAAASASAGEPSV